ncbi:hypothetical protein SE15_01595 [Thermanaerothrix daxensis]|uniref:YvlB/LiaX N-terminal domain-containing protein n=1 Tax=Thermanaerothrix daxensis TaxID=869279 RepID=A0A0P6Y3G9_9CHLR|nr:hypothetical protein [Thermanaerothrix daxensis]KPL83932.1 hypothetical protein SE15_01595 [Thermanaerothrix daxensis]
MISREERLKVLEMLQEGKITAEEAARLLEALEAAPGPKTPPPPPPPTSPPGGSGRWLRVRITDTDTGKVRANIRLPLNLVSAGIKMGMRFTPEVEGLDVNRLMDFIRSGETGTLVDVFDEEDGEHVEVFIE